MPGQIPKPPPEIAPYSPESPLEGLRGGQGRSSEEIADTAYGLVLLLALGLGALFWWGVSTLLF